MNWLFVSALVILGVCLASLVYLDVTAAEGYEDEEGFHLVK